MHKIGVFDARAADAAVGLQSRAWKDTVGRLRILPGLPPLVETSSQAVQFHQAGPISDERDAAFRRTIFPNIAEGE